MHVNGAVKFGRTCHNRMKNGIIHFTAKLITQLENLN